MTLGDGVGLVTAGHAQLADVTRQRSRSKVASVESSRELSDHEEENSETESAAAMTLLTPEENQGELFCGRGKGEGMEVNGLLRIQIINYT